ncbi:MAG: hypothetical protein AB1665_01570 [Candidatus Thermoplasmatota archaeon]
MSIRKAIGASWHVILFLLGLMCSLIAVAAYTPALPLVLLFWIVVPVLLIRLWRRVKG